MSVSNLTMSDVILTELLAPVETISATYVVGALPIPIFPEIEAVPVAVRLAKERLPENRPSPCTESCAHGVVLPMPMRPVELTKMVEVA